MTDRTVRVKLILEDRQYAGRLAEDTKHTDKLGDAAERTQKKHRAAWDTIGKGAGVAAAVGVVAVGAMVRSFMDFDSAMSQTQAATRATGTELDALRKAALQAGADTVFSATQAAQAETELSKAGVATSDILGGALTGALDLASAGQLGVADAASIAATAMTQFGLSGKDVPHIADLLAAGAGKAQGEVSDLAVALKYVGPVAHQMGISIEETTGTIAELASNGILADQAGTSLRGMLSALTSPSAKAADEMKSLGINVYDSAGNFVGFDGVAGQLHDRLGKLTNAQRDQALGVIFGNEQITAARILYAGGADAVDDWTAKVNDSGFAQEQAAAKLDNLRGDLEQFRGSLETAMIKGGSAANSSLRALVQTGTAAVNVFADLPGPMQATAVGVVAITAAGGGALAFFGSVAPKIKAARTELAQMGSAGARANTVIGGIGRAGAVAGTALVAVEALSIGVGQLQDAMVRSVPDVNRLTSSLLEARSWSDVSKALGEDVEDLGLKIRHIADPSTTQQVNKVFAGVIGQAPKSLREARAEVGQLDKALTQLVQQGEGAEAARQFRLIVEAAKAGGASVDQVKEALPQYAEALAGTANQSKLAASAEQRHAAAAARAAAALGQAGGSTKTYTGTVRDSTGALHQYDTAAAAVKASIDALNGAVTNAATADLDFRDAVARVTTSLHDNGHSLDVNSQKGRDNRRAIIAAIQAASQHAQAVADQTGSVDKGTHTFNTHIGALRRTLIQSGLTKGQVDALLHTYAKTPQKKKTDVSAPGATSAKQRMEDVREAAEKIPKSVSTTVTATVRVAGQTMSFTAGSAANFRAVEESQRHAQGGWIGGHSPHDTADNVPIWATAEEFMIKRPTARKLRRTAPGFLEALNAGQVDIGGDPSGMLGRYGRPLRFAGGGSIPAVQRWMRSTDPLNYVWAAVGPNAYDCSGYGGEAYARLTGRPSYRRYFTTSSNFASLGFRRGLGTFTIGLNPGHHMAINVAGYGGEARSTATGIFTGTSATAVTRFPQQWYLPQIGGRFVGAGGSLELTASQKAQVFRLIRPQIAKMVVDNLAGRAAGGSVTAGQLYRVNERGQEGFFVPPTNGQIIPAHAMTARSLTPAGAGGGPTIIGAGAVQISFPSGHDLSLRDVQRTVDGALDQFAAKITLSQRKGERA